MNSPMKKKKLEDNKKRNNISANKEEIRKIKNLKALYKTLHKSIYKECFTNLFQNEQDNEEISTPNKSPFIKSMSIGKIMPCEDTINLIEQDNFKQKLSDEMNKMELLSDEPEKSKYIIDVKIMHCMSVELSINENKGECWEKKLIRTNISVKYSTMKKSDGQIVSELWYQGRGEKRVPEVNDEVKKETLDMACNDNFSYILDMMKKNKF